MRGELTREFAVIDSILGGGFDHDRALGFQIEHVRDQRRVAAAHRRFVEKTEPYLLKGDCVECGSADDIAVDHIEPLSRGGFHTPDNLQLMCRRCNSRKCNEPEAWALKVEVVDRFLLTFVTEALALGASEGLNERVCRWRQWRISVKLEAGFPGAQRWWPAPP